MGALPHVPPDKLLPSLMSCEKDTEGLIWGHYSKSWTFIGPERWLPAEKGVRGKRGMHEGYEQWGKLTESHAVSSGSCVWGAFCLRGHQGNKLKRTGWNLPGGSMIAQCKMDSILVLSERFLNKMLENLLAICRVRGEGERTRVNRV